jgi:hypothetical protein
VIDPLANGLTGALAHAYCVSALRIRPATLGGTYAVT